MTTTIILTRQDTQPLTEQERRQLAALMFRVMDGHSEADRRAWRALWGAWRQMEVGEMSAIDVRVERMSGTHRRHFSLEQKFFNAQETFALLKGFRDWLKVGAGFIEWRGEAGGLVAVPRSLSWDEVDELELREVHREMVNFLRTPEAAEKLWPGLTDRAREEIVQGLLSGYNE